MIPLKIKKDSAFYISPWNALSFFRDEKDKNKIYTYLPNDFIDNNFEELSEEETP